MPATVDPLTDDRWAELVAELERARPEPPPALRERVLAAAARPPVARPRPARRIARVLVPALVAAVLLGAAATGLRSTESAPGQSVSGGARGTSANEAADSSPAYGAPGASPPPAAEEAAPAPFAPVPAGRLQEQRVALGVRVPDVDALADGTARAMETARALGGYVVAAHYDVPLPEEGDSTLVVRVPVERVQEAIARFTALGTIVSQDVRLQDLQPAYDRRARELESLRGRIARLEEQLGAPGLGEEERARLRTQLAAARRAVEARTAQQRATERQGRLARVELLLTTRSPHPVAPPEDGAGATLRAALELVGQLLVWLGAAVIVAGPFVLLAVLAVVAARSRRRVLGARLLERS